MRAAVLAQVLGDRRHVAAQDLFAIRDLAVEHAQGIFLETHVAVVAHVVGLVRERLL